VHIVMPVHEDPSDVHCMLKYDSLVVWQGYVCTSAEFVSLPAFKVIITTQNHHDVVCLLMNMMKKIWTATEVRISRVAHFEQNKVCPIRADDFILCVTPSGCIFENFLTNQKVHDTISETESLPLPRSIKSRAPIIVCSGNVC